MSRYNPKFEIGDIVQVVSKKSKHKGMFGIFKGYTDGSNDHMCKVEIGYDLIFLMEPSIKLITEKNIADLHYAEACKSIIADLHHAEGCKSSKEEMMQPEGNIEVKYEGKHIRIGVHKINGNIYIQHKDSITNFWVRFEPEYYLDYEEYIKEYCGYPKKGPKYLNMHYCRILDAETLEHYIAMFSPSEVYINRQCVYSDKCDVTYTKEKYLEDMTTHMIPNKYYPFINNVSISVDDTTGDVTIHFAVTLRYEEL